MTRAFATVRRLNRPAFAALLALDAALGMAQTGHLPSTVRQVAMFATVAAWMLFAVAVNDLADEAIDRVNLGDDASRVLVAGTASRREVATIAVLAALCSLASAAVVGGGGLIVVGAGLALAAAYSLPPFRLSSRGALTSALLPLGYVGVPYLVGAFAAGATQFHPVLLVGLYLGFTGRLVLKDFRDEHGDRLYGKRTFLVRHGRDRTLLFSAVFWSTGAAVALGGVPRRLGTMVAVLAFMATVLALLADIARDDDGARDIANIAAVAILGRALLSTVLCQLVMSIDGRSLLQQTVVGIALAVASIGRAWECHRTAVTAVDTPARTRFGRLAALTLRTSGS